MPEPAIAQRIVRAKRSLREARVPFEVPHGAALGERLATVLEVIYLIFNEGYTATSGNHWMRPTLCNEALRLGRILAERLPQQGEVHGLQALMEFQASRLAARTDELGRPVLLAAQNRRRWDMLLIRRGLAALARAEALLRSQSPGPYYLQAAIAACHARAPNAGETDWHRIALLYGELALMTASPVVELNRAVAVAMDQGPAAGLALVDRLFEDRAMRNYHWLPSVRGDLLEKLGRYDEAREAFELAAGLAGNAREQALLHERARLAANRT